MRFFVISICDDDVGEVEGAVTEDGTILARWAANDGQWRHEYFNGLITALGHEVLNWRDFPTEMYEGLEQKLKESFL